MNRSVAVLLALGFIANAFADDIPRHLAIARELAEKTEPANNEYKLGSSFIAFPGDKDAQAYQVRADCSGFLLATFKRAGYATQSQMVFLPDAARGGANRKRHASEDFVYSIEQEKGYQRIRKVEDIRPGDVLAHAMLNAADQQQTGTTGHVMFLDSAARRIGGYMPIVDGTTQYEMRIIDSNWEFLGDDDTRQGTFRNATGVGRGTIRLYANSEGELVGWARGTHRTKRFFSYDPRYPSDTKVRKAAIGRPVASTKTLAN